MIFGFDEFELDAANLQLQRAGQPIKADALVVRLLLALVQNAGRVLTKEELVEQVWAGRAVADNVIAVSVARLRKTLGHTRGEREFVATVFGRGYRFVRDVTSRSVEAILSAATRPTSEVGPPFVGRERVLDGLLEALGAARAGRGRLCALMGEPGIGKTRLVETLERALHGAQVCVAWGYCRESGDTPPLSPWLRLLREIMALLWTPELEQRLGPLASEVRTLLDERGAAVALDRDMAAMPADWSPPARHHGFEAMLRTFALAAEDSPCVLVLDDLHGADAASIELLSLLLDEIAHTRILVVATLRHVQGRQPPRVETLLPHVLGHRNCQRIILERLSAREVASYVAALVDDADGSLGRTVFAKSEGNPFFMAQLSWQLRDTGRLNPDALSDSATALELIRLRIDGLAADTRAVLSAAAVIGRGFELTVLSAITGRGPSVLMASLDDALAAEVLVAAPDSMTAFAFGHELLRAALYDALLPDERRRWHLVIARALDERSITGNAAPPSELAYHFHAALPHSDLRKTVEYCRKAAAAAAAVFANPDVVRYAHHALEALDLMESGSVRLRSSLWYMTALYGREQGIEFPRAIGKVIHLAREQGDAPMLVSAACMLNPHPGFKPVPGGNDALLHALTLGAEDRTRAIALAGLACAAPQCFEIERTDALIDEALAIAHECGSRTARRVALECQLYLQGGPARLEQATAIEDELAGVAEQDPKLLSMLRASLTIHRTLVAQQRGDVLAMTTALEYATARYRELRHGELLWHCERFGALARINAGSWTIGVATLETLHRRAEQRSIFGTEPFRAFDRAVVFGEFVDKTALDAEARSSLEYDASEPPSIWALKVRALAGAGLTDQARAALRALTAANLGKLPCDRDYLGTLGHLARAALLLQALDYAEAIYPLLSPYPRHFASQVSFLCEGSVSQLLGMLAHALGQREQAAAHFEVGIEANERAGFAPRAAEARLQLAQCLLDQGAASARPRAIALAQEARARAKQLGMRRLVRSAAAVLQPTATP